MDILFTSKIFLDISKNVFIDAEINYLKLPKKIKTNKICFIILE